MFNDDLSWPWHFYGKVKFAILSFILEEFMELVEEFCAKVNDTVKQMSKWTFLFCNRGQDHSLTFTVKYFLI